MKKLLFTIVCVFCTAMQIWASDLIVTVKSERTDAIIQEISEEEVRYKKANNPNGPTFVMKTADITTIIYANGEVQAFEHAEQVQQAPQQSQQVPQQQMIIAPVIGPQVQQGILGQVTKEGDTYYYNGQAMTRDTYLQFANQNCPAAYKAYKSGRKMLNAGGALFGVGIPVLATGIALYVIGFPRYDTIGEPALWIPGALFIGLGSGMVTASIPLMAVGSYRKRHSHDIFNEKCASPRASADRLYLDFNAGPTSAGVALRF